MTNVQGNGLVASLSGIYKSGRYSDMTVVCGTREFKVHQAVVCPRSKFFAAACDGSFQESITKRILLEDDDPDTVERMLLYLYSCDYDDGTPGVKEVSTCSKEEEADREGESGSFQTPEVTLRIDSAEIISAKNADEGTTVEVLGGESNTEEPVLLNNVLAYAIAEKYDISELKELAKTKFLSQVDTLLSAHDIPEVIKTIYKSTPSKDRDLREAVSQVCVKQIRKLMEYQGFKDIISDVGDFGIDILQETLKRDDERLAQVMDQKTKLKDKAKEIQIKMLNFKSETDHARQAIQKVIQNINDTESCGTCGADLYSQIDEKNPSVLWCVRYKDRHRAC